MSTIDAELNLLKQKIKVLEEQKRMKTQEEAGKKENSMKVLEEILSKKKAYPNVMIHTNPSVNLCVSKPTEIPRSTESFLWLWGENDKVEFLEPIFHMLKKIDERLQILETKGKEPSFEDLF